MAFTGKTVIKRIGQAIGFGVPFSLLFVFSYIAFAATIGPVGWFILGTGVAVLMGFLVGKFLEWTWEKFSSQKKETKDSEAESWKGREGVRAPLRNEELGMDTFPLRVTIAGSAGTGKTALSNQFALGQFSSAYEATIGIDFNSKSITIGGGEQVKLQCWALAGQERYRSITSAYYQNIDGVILTYDITNAESFKEEELEEWISKIKDKAPQGVPIVLVGMKSDLESKRQVSTKDGQEKAKEIGAVAFYEASAKTGENVEKIFTDVATRGMNKRNGIAEKKSPTLVPATTVRPSSASPGFFSGVRSFLSNIGQSSEPSKTGSAAGTGKPTVKTKNK